MWRYRLRLSSKLPALVLALCLCPAAGLTQTDDTGQLARSRAEYQFAIRQAIVRNWNRRKSVERAMSCEVVIDQQPDGTITDVETNDCTGDEAFQQSLQTAIWNSSPLPLPADPGLFNAQIRFTFQAQ